MNQRAMSFVFVMPLITVGCGGEVAGAGSASAAASSAPSAAPANSGTKSNAPAKTAAAAAKDADEQVDKVMVECAWTKAYGKSSWGDENLEYEVKNLSGKDLNYVQFSIYFYDATGKQLQPSSSNAQNGQPWLKAGETKKAVLTPEKAKLPAGTDAVECEVSAGAYANDAKWRNPKMGHYDRPKGGVK